MDARDPRLDLLTDLHRGARSRNREYQRFQQPAERRVFRGYRRLRSLLAELARPGIRAGARWTEAGDELRVALEIAGLGYRRVAVLAAWEAEFLLREAGGRLPVASSRTLAAP